MSNKGIKSKFTDLNFRPLNCGRRIRASSVSAALEKLDERALHQCFLDELNLAGFPRGVKEKIIKKGLRDPDALRDWISLIKARYLARKISRVEYVYLTYDPVIFFHEERLFIGRAYDDLKELDHQMLGIEKKYGLASNQCWEKGAGPPEHVVLQERWEELADEKIIETLVEFGLEDLGKMFSENRDRLDDLNERGRRAVKFRHETVPALRDIISRYEACARQVVEAKAYSAAVILLGSCIEGVLLLRCLNSPCKASRVAKSIRRGLRPKNFEDITSWRFATLIEVCLQALWLPHISTEFVEYDSASLAHMLRHLRDCIHPGKMAREKPWIEFEERDYQDANAIYLALASQFK
ncbi:MAG: hypothetical protein PHP93_06400 [Kiritimatiellales bacterium]|nr:hypothetical protein [Kiritimatiellales bacterium]